MNASPIPFAEFRTKIETLYSAGKHSPSTSSKMRLVLATLEKMNVTSTSDLTTETMARYVALRGPNANANTTNGYLSHLSAACGYAFEEGWIERMPNFKRVRLRPSPMVRNTPPSYESLSKLLDTLYYQRTMGWKEHRLCALTWTFALTAIRLREALYLRLEDVDLGENPRLIISPRRRLKNLESAREIPIPATLALVLREWLPNSGPDWLFPGAKRVGPWTGGSPGYKSSDALKSLAQECGIKHITWHSLRHAFGTYALEQWDVPLWIVQRVMGHTDSRTTERYLHLERSPAIAAAMGPVRYAVV